MNLQEKNARRLPASTHECAARGGAAAVADGNKGGVGGGVVAVVHLLPLVLA